MFSREDYENIYDLAFKPGYPGYRPKVAESPEGDGKFDAAKRYSHIAPKYLTDVVPFDDAVELAYYHQRAFRLAREIAERVGWPAAYMPDARYGALRILEYPPGAVSNRHEDSDLFTLMLYRDDPTRFRPDHGVDAEDDIIHEIRKINQQAHLGKIAEILGLGRATPHEVVASDRVQRSLVYFAIPDHAAVLPTGETVRDWLNRRMAASRTAFKAYE